MYKRSLSRPIAGICSLTAFLFLTVILMGADPVRAIEPCAVDIGSIAVAATETDGGQICPASLLLEDDHESLQTLRKFRDESLMKTQSGRTLTRAYYRYGPQVCIVLEDNPELKQKSALLLKETIGLIKDQNGNITSQGLSDILDCIGDVLGEIDDCGGFDFDCVFDVLSEVLDCF